MGETQAVLFDTGPGVRDIKPVVESLTMLPVIVCQSHLHYDHIGNHINFDGAAFPDLPQLRRRAQSDMFQVSSKEHLGFIEKFKAPNLIVSELWAPDSQIDLGGRTLTVIHAPGHSPDSIVLLDRNAINPKAIIRPKIAVTWGKIAPEPRPNRNGMNRTETMRIAIHIFFMLERTIGST